MNIKLPYVKSNLPLDVPDENLLEVILSKESIQPRQPELMINEALHQAFVLREKDTKILMAPQGIITLLTIKNESEKVGNLYG